MELSTEQFREMDEIMEEWQEVFGEVLKMMPMFGPGDFPLFRECLKKKSKQPLDDYLEAHSDKDF